MMLRRVVTSKITAAVGTHGLIMNSRVGRPILTIVTNKILNTNRSSAVTTPTRRNFAATSREKRALNSKQIEGETQRVTAASKTQQTTSTTTKSNGNTNSTTNQGSGIDDGGGGGGGGGTVLALLAIVGGGAMAAYYNDMLPPGLLAKQQNDEKPGKEKKDSLPTVLVDKKERKKKKMDDNPMILPVKETEELKQIIATELPVKETEELKKVIAPEIATEKVDIVIPEAPVAIMTEQQKTEIPEPSTLIPTATIEPQTTIVVESSIPASSPPHPPPPLNESTIMAEVDALKKELHKLSDQAITEAHTELAKLCSMNMMNEELDSMTSSQLKVRLVQMAKDLEERTKWEAVRLQEFLSIKEKEVEDRYVLLIKKLRLEAAHLQEQKLSQQKKAFTAEAEEVLREEQTRSAGFLDNSLKIQEKAHEDDKIAFEKKTEEAMSAKYEELFGNSLSKMKGEFAAKMSQRTQQMEQLSKKLTDLESSLKTSKDFQVGSLQAHRITAAAIALIERLESGEPSGAALNALKAVASDNAVVSAAVQALPESVSNSGLSTVQELQAGFEEKVYPQCRRAANVPKGQDGLEGQLLGSIFSTLRSPPDPDEAAPEMEKDTPQYVLSRARRHVKLGELDKAVIELKKLKGQAAYTAKDWEVRAKDRVAVEKALKVIRMECALANENLSKGAA